MNTLLNSMASIAYLIPTLFLALFVAFVVVLVLLVQRNLARKEGAYYHNRVIHMDDELNRYKSQTDNHLLFNISDMSATRHNSTCDATTGVGLLKKHPDYTGHLLVSGKTMTFTREPTQPNGKAEPLENSGNFDA